MTIRYVGLGGNDGNSGLTWALRKLTLNGVEDTPVVAGDRVFVGPGVYREQLDVDVSGGNLYSAGTVSVTNGSQTVTGAGTLFLANVAVGYLFHVIIYAQNNDGVTNGTATFTSGAGNFQAGMIGKPIQIYTKGTYVIGAVAAANSITLVDHHGLGWPVAGINLDYTVMSGEGQYEITAVVNNTTLTLAKPWCGPTLTGLAYLTYNPITYIGDVTGENTDSVGGIVRITGSDNDQTHTRTQCINGQNNDYRTFRGIWFDTAEILIRFDNADRWLFEDCSFQGGSSSCIATYNGPQYATTIRRCRFLFVRYASSTIYFTTGADTIDSGHLIENCFFDTFGYACYFNEYGGTTFRNNTVWGGYYGVYATSLAVASTVDVKNNIFQGVGNVLRSIPVDGITEDYNSFYQNSTDRNGVATGGNSVSFTALLQPPILYDGIEFPWEHGNLSEWSQMRSRAGSFETCAGLHGIRRPVTSSKRSWGPYQFWDMERETGTVRTGSVSMVLHDAGRHQIWVPVTATSTTIKVYVYREANYAGLLPQMIIKQPGVADRITTDVGAVGGWNLLTDTFVPAAIPPYVVVELVSRNTNGAADEVYFDDLDVS